MSGAIHRMKICCRGAVRLCCSPQSVLVYGRRTFLARHVRPTLAAIAARKKRQKNVPANPRSAHLEWNYSAELGAFAARLGESVEESVLRQVFTERSHLELAAAERRRLSLPEPEVELADNSVLAARGRQLMAALTAGWLRAALPRLPEDGVQAMTAQLTSHVRIARLAAGFGIKDLVLSQEYPPSEAALVRCLEAFVAALDQSDAPERAPLFVRDFVVSPVAVTDLSALWHIEDPLALLADVLVRCGRPTPEPRLLRSAGPGTILAVYVVGIYSDRRLLGSAPGESPEEAASLAARVYLDRLMGIGEASAAPDLTAATPRHTAAAPLSDWRPL